MIKIVEFKVGTKVDATVCVKNISERAGARGPYMTGEFVDNTKTIPFKIFQPTPAILKLPELLAEKRENGDFLIVSVKAKVDEYNGNPQLLVDDLVLVDSATVDPAEFIYTEVQDTEKTDCILYIQNLVTEIQSPVYKRIFENVLSAPFMDKFFKYPAAVSHHHAYLYGLMQHSCEVCRLALAMFDSNREYYSKIADRDALIVSALFHDLGKIIEYGIDLAPYFIERKMPHKVGSSVLVRKAQRNDQITEEMDEALDIITTIIYNHEGMFGDAITYEKCPFAEAHILFAADHTSAKLAPIYYGK